jgi:hypothetical protein
MMQNVPVWKDGERVMYYFNSIEEYINTTFNHASSPSTEKSVLISIPEFNYGNPYTFEIKNDTIICHGDTLRHIVSNCPEIRSELIRLKLIDNVKPLFTVDDA